MRLRAGLLAAAAVLLAAALLGRAATAERAEPVLGGLDRNAVLMGGASAGAPGEVWAYRLLPLDLPPLPDPRDLLGFGEPANPRQPDPQLVFFRAADDQDGFIPASTPVGRDGRPFRGGIPNRLSARITPKAGGLLVGTDSNRAVGRRTVVLVRDPGGRFTELPEPPPGVVEPEEALAAEEGAGRVAADAFDAADDRTGAAFGLVGPNVESAVARWDGRAWSREEVEVPAGAGEVRLGALAMVGADDGWLVLTSDTPAGNGVLLFARERTGPTARWVPRPLGAPLFEQAATPARGVSQLAVLGGAAQPLTATKDGVWIDVGMRVTTPSGLREQDATLFRRAGSGDVTTFCDGTGADGARLCDEPLGFRFGRRAGYRSFGWAGEGTGRRVVTNPLDVGGDDESNAGSYAVLRGGTWVRRPGGGGSLRSSGAFATPDRGWLEGPVQVTDAPPPSRTAAWPLAVRSPLTAVATAPGQPAGALGSPAIAVGAGGAVARYTQAQGWQREFLLTSTGAVSSPVLRGVAWPEPARAYAVGDGGAMWLWRSETALWERDPGAPPGFDQHLTAVAFDPSDPQRGYAVGRNGTLLRYGKSWEQVPLPAGFETADLTSITFAGSTAYVAAGSDLLVDTGSGFEVDEGVRAITGRSAARPLLLTVAGLPDGGVVAGGRGLVLARDGADQGWRQAPAPLPDQTVIAAAPFRDAGIVRAVVSVVPGVQYPPATVLPPEDPDVPPLVLPPFPLPGDGYVLRETASGWRDEQRAAFTATSDDRPRKADPVLAFALDAAGGGWAVGGWAGTSDAAGRGTSSSGLGSIIRQRVQTGAVLRYDAGGEPARPVGATSAPLTVDAAKPTFVVAGHAACAGPCAKLAGQALAPDVHLAALEARVAGLVAQGAAPRALLYTGGRLPATREDPMPAAEAARYAELLATDGPVPTFPAVSGADSAGGAASAFRTAFSGFPAPFGTGGAPAGITPVELGAAPGPGARTHYAFDSTGPSGAVRVVVIDNSRGSLAESDPHQNPAEPQQPWLVAVLTDARTRGIPALVVGSRDLNERLVPAVNVASDGDELAALLVEQGASAYLHERPEEQRVSQVPAGGTTTIPQLGTGTLGYRSPITNSVQEGQPDALFGDSGYLLVSVDTAQRDPATNRAPVTARLIPLVEDLSLSAVDGTLLRRSRPALFTGLGRRPLAGDRWGPVSASDGNPSPAGSDPYTAFPPAPCVQSTCASRMTPEFTFRSSDPDIADFVRQDASSTNLRKPFQDATGRTVTDATSGLLCAFNPGTTTVTVSAGGLTYATQVTVLAGSVQQPCGTRPLDPSRFAAAPPPAAAAPPAAAPAAAAAGPSPTPAPPPPPPPSAPTPTPPATKAVPTPPPVIAPIPFTPAAPPSPTPAERARVPTPPPPPAGGFARPIPPGGVGVRVFEEKREEEAAPEQSQAFARYVPADHGPPLSTALLGLAVLAALAGATLSLGARHRERHVAPAFARARSPYDPHRRRR